MTPSVPPSADWPAPLRQVFERSGLAALRLAGRTLLPIVQGGMGVGVSAHRLAGSVAALGAVGTISSVDLRRHHPDLMEATRAQRVGEAAKQAINAANLEALRREIAAAQALAQGRGLLAVNVMRAVAEYAPSVTAALEAGIDAVVVGAGLPLDLPDLAREHPRAALIPILSDARGVALVVKKWERKQRIADLDDPRFDFDQVLPAVNRFLREAGIEREVPLIAAGGVRTCEDIARLQALGAAAVQLGTPFVATDECDAHPLFKKVLAEARDEDIVEFMSVAGLPARAVRTPWLAHYLKALPRLAEKTHRKPRCTLAFDCLAQCGLRDGTPGWGQFCIDTQLAAGLRGDEGKGLFFRGTGALPFGQRIVAVRALVERLLTPGVPLGAPPSDTAASAAV